MRILVIGGTRFVGARTVRRLHDAGAQITVFHRGTTVSPVLPKVEHVLDPAAEYPVVGFPERLRRDWDVVVHMVAMGRDDADAAVRMVRGRTGRLVLISSCDVYRAYGRLTRSEPGPPDPVPLTEEAPLRSVLYPYRGMEAQLGAFARDYDKTLAEAAVSGADGLDWTILRLPKVYGPEDNGDLSTVYGFAARPAWRWTHGHVENVAAAIATAATHPRARNRIYNLGEAATPTVAPQAGLPVRARSEPSPPPFDYAQHLVTDTARIRAELGYADVVDEERAMRDCASGSSPVDDPHSAA